MTVHRHLEDLADVTGPLHLALGVFDGVHLGHQAVIGAALKFADTGGGSAVVVTFHPHPASFFAPERARRLLTSLEHRLQLIESGGIHEAIVLAFDATLANAEPEAFIQKLITVNPQGLASVSVGADWTFGKGRRGNVSLLRQLGMACGFEVSAQPLVEVEGRRVSSTAIRLAISQGDLASATAMLGRPFTLLGTVVPGRRLGREIGFPTANLETGALMPPASGVYAVRVELPLGGSRNGVANLGWRPTVEGSAGGAPRLEVHLFDFDGDLYGKALEVMFIERLREERKFPDLESLRSQIQLDALAARKVLG